MKILINSIKNVRVLVLAGMFVALSTHVTNAQNFSNLKPTEDQAALDEQITQQEIERILANEIYSSPNTGEVGIDFSAMSNYTLGTNDVIEIAVLRHPEVSGQYVLNSEGKIQYDFVGDVSLSGLTKSKSKEIIAEKLSSYIISPEVTVKIVGYNSKVVYVIGEVGRPGKVFMRGDTITVKEALMQAGLPLLSAKMKKSSVVTPSDSGKMEVKPVNVHKLLVKGDLRENLVMKPGDTLYLPPTVMTKVMRTISPVAAPIGTAAGTGRTLTTGF